MGLFGMLSPRIFCRTRLRFLQAENVERKPFPIWMSKMNPRKYGRHGELSTNQWEDQELAMLALHLLQIALVFIQTLLIQEVLTEPAWMNKMTKEDLRGLTPLIYSNVNPYGLIRLNMTERLAIERAEAV